MVLYGCPPSVMPSMFNCTGNGGGYMVPGALGPVLCKVSVVIPVLQGNFLVDIGNLSKVEEDIKEGFVVNWKENDSLVVLVFNPRAFVVMTSLRIKPLATAQINLMGPNVVHHQLPEPRKRVQVRT